MFVDSGFAVEGPSKETATTGGGGGTASTDAVRVLLKPSSIEGSINDAPAADPVLEDVFVDSGFAVEGPSKETAKTGVSLFFSTPFANQYDPPSHSLFSD